MLDAFQFLNPVNRHSIPSVWKDLEMFVVEWNWIKTLASPKFRTTNSLMEYRIQIWTFDNTNYTSVIRWMHFNCRMHFRMWADVTLSGDITKNNVLIWNLEWSESDYNGQTLHISNGQDFCFQKKKNSNANFINKQTSRIYFNNYNWNNSKFYKWHLQTISNFQRFQRLIQILQLK